MSDLKAYKGNAPYIFVSYAHRDSDRVFPLLQALQDAGYRIWFDHGIEAGTEWSNNIAQHLSGCSAFLFFASKSSAASENCLDEVAYAKSHNKPALLAYLEDDVVLPAGADMQTARFQRMFVTRSVNLSAFVENFSAAAIFDICRGDAVAVSKTTAPVVKTKKPLSKGLLAGIVAAVAVIAILAVVLLLPKPDTSDSNTPPTSSSAPIVKPEVIELSNSLQDHTFRLGGVVYKLPVPYAALAQNGWTLSSGDVTSESWLGGQQEAAAKMVKDGKQILAYIYNDGEHAKKISDCLVGAVEAEQDDVGDFCVAAGMTFGATEDALTNALGTPSERNETDSLLTLTWNIGQMAQLKLRLYSGNQEKYSTITLSNYVLSTEKFENKEEAPSYLSDYIAPDALGSDLLSSIVSVDGVLYELPAPLQAFLDNGWSISSGAGSVLSGGTAELKLKNGEHTLEVRVANLSLYKTSPANCVVTRIYAENTGGTVITLPGGISLGMTEAEVSGLIPDIMDVYEGTYSISYSLSDYAEGRDFRLNVVIDKETRVVSSMQVINTVSGLIP